MCGDTKLLEEFYLYKTGTVKKYCKSCLAKRKRAWVIDNPTHQYRTNRRKVDKQAQAADEAFDKWLRITSESRKQLLTEDNWLEICSHFNGCAICGNEHIETREFFVGFQDGGKYTPWNILPMCGTCAGHTRLIKNPFKWIDRYVGTAHRIGLDEDRRRRLLQFFEEQLKKAAESIESKDKSI